MRYLCWVMTVAILSTFPGCASLKGRIHSYCSVSGGRIIGTTTESYQSTCSAPITFVDQSGSPIPRMDLLLDQGTGRPDKTFATTGDRGEVTVQLAGPAGRHWHYPVTGCFYTNPVAMRTVLQFHSELAKAIREGRQITIKQPLQICFQLNTDAANYNPASREFEQSIPVSRQDFYLASESAHALFIPPCHSMKECGVPEVATSTDSDHVIITTRTLTIDQLGFELESGEKIPARRYLELTKTAEFGQLSELMQGARKLDQAWGNLDPTRDIELGDLTTVDWNKLRKATNSKTGEAREFMKVASAFCRKYKEQHGTAELKEVLLIAANIDPQYDGGLLQHSTCRDYLP